MKSIIIDIVWAALAFIFAVIFANLDKNPNLVLSTMLFLIGFIKIATARVKNKML